MEYDSIIESILFASGDPFPIERLMALLDLSREDVLAAARRIGDAYRFENRGIRLLILEDSLQLGSAPENADWVRRALDTRKPARLSPAALEVLAIVAYKQPVTKGEIEAIRGIKCDRVMEGLVAKGLVEAVGRSTAIGRPVLYGTTDLFLKNFGFTSLKDLPEIEDIEVAINTEDAEDAEVVKDYDQIELDI